uniref:Serine/threonine-protein kinase BSK1-like TPR repeats domain-containing protein n=2 Tax=Hordeum vulgare subsp. vulgare TaxID=112509 RepID=A0A8I7BK79_HORVV
MNTAACSPSSSAPPPPLAGVDVAEDDALEDEETRRWGNRLLEAACDGDLDLVARVVEALGMAAAAVRSGSGHGALHEAAANGRTLVCRYLVQDLGFPVDPLSDTGETPLLLAATLGHTATAACLLERGASPHTPDHDGETPLHWAAYNGDLLLAQLLLDRGADVGAATPRGTALHIAATQAHPNLVAFLLRHGADPNKLVCRVFTPLVSSILGGSLECMKLLIQAGANVNADGSLGTTTTPLLVACSRRGNIRLVECLLEAGADPNITDELGRLPIEIAAVHAERKVVRALFPVTQRPPTLLGWSVASILRRVKSASYRERMIKLECKRKDELKLEGNKAFEIKDYDTAILLYSMALKLDDMDATLYSNRSVSWLHLGDGDEALSDAQACTRVWPDWEKGYYRQGMAFRLLEDYVGACAAFRKALELDPGNPIIVDALRDVSQRSERVPSMPC